MSDINLNPEIIKFRDFLNNHPKLIREIRKNGKNWQELFEQWVLLGEDDSHWEQFKEKKLKNNNEQIEEENSGKLDLKTDLVKQILKYGETMDLNKIQEQVQQLSKTVSTVQEVVQQYQKTNKNKNNKNDNPFNWFHD